MSLFTDIILISTPYLRLQFPIRAQFWCSLGSNLLVVMLLRLLAECIHDKHGKIDVLSSINTSLQNESATPAASKPYRITDLITRNLEGSNDKGNFRHFMTDLHLWMQAWSDEGETMLVSVEGTDKFDNSTPVVDC